jgi:hypothetical protein
MSDSPKKRALAERNQASASVSAQRVSLIRRLMAERSWGPVVRAKLAEEWGIHWRSVSKLATEASRSLRCDEGELAHEREKLSVACEEVIRHAFTDRNAQSGQLDLKAALDAIRELAKFRGVAPPEQAQQIVAPVVINVSPEWLSPPVPAITVESSPVLEERILDMTNGRSNGSTH